MTDSDAQLRETFRPPVTPPDGARMTVLIGAGIHVRSTIGLWDWLPTPAGPVGLRGQRALNGPGRVFDGQATTSR